jgi:hypothetical protein
LGREYVLSKAGYTAKGSRAWQRIS